MRRQSAFWLRAAGLLFDLNGMYGIAVWSMTVCRFAADKYALSAETSCITKFLAVASTSCLKKWAIIGKAITDLNGSHDVGFHSTH